MKKLIAIPAIALCAVGFAACGGTTQAHKPTAPKVAAAAKTDLALCGTLRSDITGFVAATSQASSMDDATAETYASGTLMPKLQQIIREVGKLTDGATSVSDQRRLNGALTGLGTMYGGLQALSQGDVSGVQMISQGTGQLSSIQDTSALAICGGGAV